jgi:hypothetical protein
MFHVISPLTKFSKNLTAGNAEQTEEIRTGQIGKAFLSPGAFEILWIIAKNLRLLRVLCG